LKNFENKVHVVYCCGSVLKGPAFAVFKVWIKSSLSKILPCAGFLDSSYGYLLCSDKASSLGRGQIMQEGVFQILDLLTGAVG